MVAGADVSRRVLVVEVRDDTSGPDQRESPVERVPSSTTRTRTRLATKSADLSETGADTTDFVADPRLRQSLVGPA